MVSAVAEVGRNGTHWCTVVLDNARISGRRAINLGGD